MFSYNDLKIGTSFILDGEPYEVLEYEFLRMQQRKPVAKTKIKNLITGKVMEKNFHQNESFEEADIVKNAVVFIYGHRGEYWFRDKDDPAKRFSLKEEVVGQSSRFLKPNTPAVAVVFRNRVINITMPVKVELEVKETPPGERGNTAQSGTKIAVLETGVKVSVPLFVNEGDIVRINTESGEYVERVKKS